MNRVQQLNEQWREYEFGRPDDRFVYRIHKPRLLVVGLTTHRVVDSVGVTHCVPVPGRYWCVLRWMADPGHDPVAF